VDLEIDLRNEKKLNFDYKRANEQAKQKHQKFDDIIDRLKREIQDLRDLNDELRTDNRNQKLENSVLKDSKEDMVRINYNQR
jgi:hypothetical protein